MQNQLYPVFLKVTELNTLIIGGGSVAFEKLSFLLKSSPDAKVQMVSKMFNKKTITLANKYRIKMFVEPYDIKFLEDKQIVIVATDNMDLNKIIYKNCKERGILVNVADNPKYCDFYMGGIVTKGNIKIAISTNGKSPTIAKRLRQFFEDILPPDINELAENLNKHRKTIKGDFKQKIKKLNDLTKELVSNNK